MQDGEKCVELNASWGKGYSRKGAALHALGRLEDAEAAFDAGLAVDPSNAALKDGLAEVQAAQRRAAPASAGAGFPGGNPFGGNIIGRLAANPKFVPYLADPSFVGEEFAESFALCWSSLLRPDAPELCSQDQASREQSQRALVCAGWHDGWWWTWRRPGPAHARGRRLP